MNENSPNNNPNNGQPPVPPPVYPQYSMGDNTKAFSILSYIWILWLVGLVADRNNPKVRFHVNQGIILTICEVILEIGISVIHRVISILFQGILGGMVFSPLASLLNGLISLAGFGVCFAFAIVGILNAVQDRQTPLPVIGTLFQVLK